MNSEDIKTASRLLASCSESEINALLVDIADELERRIPEVLEANAKDQARMDPANPMFDRLVLNEERLRGIAADTRKVATLPSPLGRTLEERTLPNGLEIRRVSVPFGVIGVIYEARPNVTVDVASLCLKAGSACILKGGSDADDSCQALVRVIHAALSRHGLPAEAVTLLPATREATAELLAARGLVDVLIPRGSSRLINYVRENASVPVIETGAGVVHCYVDGEADLDMAARIVENAKCRRVSVCNALDCLLVDKSLEPQLDRILAPMQGRVTFHRDEASWGTEWLSYDPGARHLPSRRGFLGHRVALLRPGHPSGGRRGRGDGPHPPLRLGPLREHRDAEPSYGGEVPARCGRRLRLLERTHLLHRRRAVRSRRRDRHFHAEAACQRTDGAGGHHHLQMDDKREWTDTNLTSFGPTTPAR